MKRKNKRAIVESLEVRRLFASIVVNTVGDTVDANPAVTSLREAITQANSDSAADTITFDLGPGAHTINLSGSGLPSLTRDADILGPGASLLTVDGQAQGSVFDVDGGTVATFSGLTISGGLFSIGGGVVNLGILTIRDCVISDNTASESGGGIFQTPSGSLRLENTVLSGNVAGSGGGIFASGTVSVVGSTITENTAIGEVGFGGYGGGIFNTNLGTLSVEGSTIDDNHALTAGGGISNGFSEGGFGEGAGVGGTVTISDSTISDNTATDASAVGGGILNVGGTLALDGSTLSGNSAGEGGAIYNLGGTVAVDNSTLSSNRAFQGGGICNALGTVTVQSSTLSYNSASAGGGGGIYNGLDSTLTVQSCTINGNDALSGGGIENVSSLTIQGSTISDNTADLGGGIANFQGTVSVQSTTLTGNSASFDGGGGIFNYYDSTLTVQNSTLSGNTALAGRGGGISNLGDVSISATTLSSNSAGIGGGIFNGGFEVFGLGQVTLIECTLSDNSARNGGGIYNGSAATVIVLNSTFSTNSAQQNGGGIFNEGGFIEGPAILTVELSTLRGNSAINGGAVYNFGTITILDSTLSGNTAQSSGGGVTNHGTLAIDSCTLNGNNAIGIFGGAIFTPGINAGSSATIGNSTISGNSAFNGGGIYGGVFTLTNSTVSGNQAIGYDDTFEDPPIHYPGQGGGIFSTGIEVNIRNVIVALNTAEIDANVSGPYTGAFNFIGGDPKLGPLANNGGPTSTMRLLPGSPCFNAGDPAFAPPPATDQRGLDRVFGGRVDIGAYEGQTKDLINDLIYKTGQAGQHGTINGGQTNSMTNLLGNALNQLDGDKGKDAVTSLQKFIKDVDARIKTLSTKDANYASKLAELNALKAQASGIIQELI